MFNLILVVHIILCISIITLVLLQHGKGADAGVVMGGSAGESILGAGSAGNFITKLTTSLFIGFMISSVLLVKAYSNKSPISVQSDVLSGSVMEKPVEEKAVDVAPVVEEVEAAVAKEVEAAPVAEKTE